MKYIYILAFVLALNSCSTKKEEGSHQSLSSTTDQCDPEEAKSHLTKLFDNYYRYPPFIVAVAARTIRECLGIVAFEIELDDYYKKSKEKYALVRPKRSFASVDYSTQAEYEREFKNWSEAHKAVDLTSKTVKYTGMAATVVVGGILLFTAPVGVAVTSAGWTAVSGEIFNKALDEINKGIEVGSSAVLDKMIRDPRIDYKELERVYHTHSGDPDQGEKAYNEELLRQTYPYPDLADIPSVDDKFRVTKKQIETAYRYSGHQALSLEKAKKSIAELKEDIKTMKGNRDKFIEGQVKLMSRVTDGLSTLTDSFDALSTQTQYLLRVKYDDMSPEEKLYAIEKLNFGEFENPEERKRTISQLKTQVTVGKNNKKGASDPVEDMKSDFKEGAKYIQDTMEILNNLGLSNPKHNEIANAVINAWSSYVQFYATDYVGAIASFTRIFIKDHSNLNHEQIMKAMVEMQKLLQQSIKLQKQTMILIAQLSDQIDLTSRKIQNTLEATIDLQRYDFLSNYIEKLSFIAECESFLMNIKTNILTFDKTNQELQRAGLLTAVDQPDPNSRSSFPSDKIPTTIDLTVLAMKGLPIVSFHHFHSVLSQQTSVSTGLRTCLPKLNAVANQLAAFAQGKGQLDGNFTSSAQVIANAPDRFLRHTLVRRNSVRKSQFQLLHTLISESDTKYKSAPNQILFAGLNPSFSITDLIGRVSWLRKNSNIAKEYIDKKKIGPLLERILLNGIDIDPQFLISFLRSYLQIYALAQFINPNSSSDRFVANLGGLLVSNQDSQIEQTLLSLARLVDLTIFWQTLLGGDVLYEIYDAHFYTFPKSGSKNPDDDILVDDIISSQTESKMHSIEKILRNSPNLLRGLVKYRMVKALKNDSRFSYMLKYEFATQSKYLELLSDLYAKIGMRVFESTTDGKLYASFIKIDEKPPDGTPKTAHEDDKLFNSASGHIDQKVEAQKDIDEISQFENKIEVLTPEEMYDDRLAPTEYTVELLKLREALLLEAYHYKSQTTNPQSKIDLIYKSLKAVVTM